MKYRKMWIAGLALVVVIVVARWLVFPMKPFSIVPALPATPRNDTVVAAPAPPTTYSPEGTQKIEQEEKKRSIFRAIESANMPISFWGQVVDQGGDPVPGVSIRYSYSVERGNTLGVPWSDTKVFKGEITSTPNGIFAITGLRGSSMTIESLQKEGFQHNPRGAMVFNYFGHTASGKFVADQNNPVHFVMVNKATVEPLVTYGGSFGKTMRLPGDGTSVRWNVWKGQPDSNGELQLTLKREPAVITRVGQPVTWSAKVEVIGGGIVEASPDELLYRAPAEGYVPVVDYPKAEQKGGVPARSFYVRTANGKYGRIELDLYVGDEGPTARCLIKAYMNPSGSRILEGGNPMQALSR